MTLVLARTRGSDNCLVITRYLRDCCFEAGRLLIISRCQAILCRCPFGRDVSRLYQLDLRQSPNQTSLKFKFIVGGVKRWVAVYQVIRRVTVNTPTSRIHLLVICVHL